MIHPQEFPPFTRPSIVTVHLVAGSLALSELPHTSYLESQYVPDICKLGADAIERWLVIDRGPVRVVGHKRCVIANEPASELGYRANRYSA